MKAPWPSLLLALATSSPHLLAQDRTPAPPSAPATAAPAPSAPPAPPSPTPSSAAAPAPADGAAPATPPADAEAPPAPSDAASEGAPAPAPQSGRAALFAGSPPEEEAPAPAPTSKAEEPAEQPAAKEAPTRLPSSNRGHFRLGARAGMVAPFGVVAVDTPLLDVAGMGAGYGLDLSFGVAEDITIGAYGDLLVLDRTQSCSSCAPLSYGAGLMVRYHLVQGLRFDPWASYGLGVIGLGGVPPSGEGSYVGLEWMRLTFGGDWYALPNLGIGPYVELGAGSFWTVPESETAGGVHFRFQLGMRIVLDLPGRRE